ncbi:MAG: imidazoleglycerol-phosphate dehydratase HisB [Dehalococcoidales bacterium]|nr:imidazoleglycerol-phosphate dehydratase HisB [Dehalococcoidales bacterium]
MSQVDTVLERVIKLQESGGYSDQQMADKIGCSRPLYQRTRTGKIPVGGRFLKGALGLLEGEQAEGRKATVTRQTKETSISLSVNIDGSGTWDINTGERMFDHLVSQLARHGLFDIKLSATGDDQHHIVEDVAICLGQAFGKALGERRGIVRMADVTVPMDETLVTVAVDIGGRGYPVIDLPLTGNDMSGLAGDLVRHFLETFAIEARMNLHVTVLRGTNDHHQAEAAFKALGRALDAATKVDERIRGELPTTKGVLE